MTILAEDGWYPFHWFLPIPHLLLNSMNIVNCWFLQAIRNKYKTNKQNITPDVIQDWLGNGTLEIIHREPLASFFSLPDVSVVFFSLPDVSEKEYIGKAGLFTSFQDLNNHKNYINSNTV